MPSNGLSSFSPFTYSMAIKCGTKQKCHHFEQSLIFRVLYPTVTLRLSLCIYVSIYKCVYIYIYIHTLYPCIPSDFMIYFQWYPNISFYIPASPIQIPGPNAPFGWSFNALEVRHPAPASKGGGAMICQGRFQLGLEMYPHLNYHTIFIFLGWST